MRYLKKAVLLFVLFFLYIYVLVFNNIPDIIEIFQGEKVNTVSSNIENIEVIPSGEVVGIKLYTNGVLVVGSSSIEGADGKIYKPFQNTGIEEGDSITQINGVQINTTDELIKNINNSEGNEIEITFTHDEQEKTAKIIPAKIEDGSYKLGLWVRDSAAGVGTMTFYNEETQSFTALGHAITDVDTGDIINTSSGEVDEVEILSIVKGEENLPGKIEGTIINENILGNIYSNTKFGIYGIIKNPENLNLDYSRKMKVASRKEIQVGQATCLSGIDGEIKEYTLEIDKIYINNNRDNKSMVIRITDEELIEKTGGIIQGMSGSPIIQNGKFVGAITHVLVKSPEIGYAVFADLMLKY